MFCIYLLVYLHSITHIRKSFKEEIPSTTKIIIAQRISSIEDANQIIVMDNGNVVQKGTHDQLIKQKGIYYDFVNGKKQAEN